MVKKLLMANEAFAYAACEAGAAVVAGYPGTPSSEVVETVAKLRAQGVAKDVYVEWSTNEKAALEVCVGASLAGKRALFTCKQVGLNVASDSLLSLAYIGVKGGLVLFVADDPGPISSQTEQDTRRFAAFAKVPVLDPSTPEEGAAMIKEAFALSEMYGTPVIVRSSTRVSHASTFFDVPEETHIAKTRGGGWKGGESWVTLPAKSYHSHKRILDNLEQIAKDCSVGTPYVRFNPVQIVGAEAKPAGEETDACPKLGIVAGGVSAAYVREALRMIAQDAAAAGVEVPAYKLMQIGTPYPWPTGAVDAFARGLEQIFVYEELDDVLEDGLWGTASVQGIAIHGRRTKEVLVHGENSVDDAYARLAKFLGVADSLPAAKTATYNAEGVEPLPTRPPVLCAGCPHRGSFYAVKKALNGRLAAYCGDIGCYTLGNGAPLCTIETCLCMGAGITMAQGFAAADTAAAAAAALNAEEPPTPVKAVAFVGDSTFFASGLTGIVNAAYNQHDITVFVLDNSTTAMTGAQPHPGTGITMMGARHEGVSIEGMLKAAGFGCVLTADPLNVTEATAAAKEAIDFAGPSAVIMKSPCIQLIPKGPASRIDTEKCTGCKICINSIGCPGIAFSTKAQGPKSGSRGQAVIDPDQCNGCGLCTQLCPFKAIDTAEQLAAKAASATDASAEAKGGSNA